MSSIKLTIPFTPIPKASVRFGKGRTYNPTQKGMKRLRDHVKGLLPTLEGPLLSGALLVIAHFRIPLQKSITPPRRYERHNSPHSKRPDGDNLEKFLNDALNGIIWTDDSNIAVLLRIKSMCAMKHGETILYAKEISSGPIDFDQILQELNEHMRPQNDAEKLT